MSDDDYNPYLPDGPGSRMDIKDGPGLADFLPDVSGGYKRPPVRRLPVPPAPPTAISSKPR